MSQVFLGIVDSFGAKGFGFLHKESVTDELALEREHRIFFHVADVLGHVELHAGDPVRFQVIQAPKGLRAIQIHPLKSGEVL